MTQAELDDFYLRLMREGNRTGKPNPAGALWWFEGGATEDRLAAMERGSLPPGFYPQGETDALLRVLRGVVLGEWPSYESWVARHERFGLSQEGAEMLVEAMRELDQPPPGGSP